MLKFQEYTPYGVNPRKGDKIAPTVHRFYQGDTVKFKLNAEFDDGTKLTDGDKAVFTLVDRRFKQQPPIWQTTLELGGIKLLKDGVVEVTVPPDIADELRRGSFLFSLRMIRDMGIVNETVQEGTLLIEYGADAPTPTVGYK